MSQTSDRLYSCGFPDRQSRPSSATGAGGFEVLIADCKKKITLPIVWQNRAGCVDYNLQFAINTSKPPAPVALQGRLCLSGKPHEYKRSLVWLNLPYPTKLGKPRVRRPPLSISILQRRQGTPQPNLPPSTNKYENFLSQLKKKFVNVTGEAEKLQSGYRENPVTVQVVVMCRPYGRVWILGRNIGSAGAAVVCAWSA